MKKLILCFILFLTVHSGYGQAYVPIPVDSATWRYRFITIDDRTSILDNILFVNGQDTVANGHVYRQLFSRTYSQSGTDGFNPPVITTVANTVDRYYGAIRDTNQKIWMLAGAGEQLLFDFTVSVGGFIPSYSKPIEVIAIDSVELNGVYHKRYLTTDTGYYTIEGVGSSRGILPALDEGTGGVVFMCFTGDITTFSPDPTVPCTAVYPQQATAVSNVNSDAGAAIYPVPATNMLHISVPRSQSVYHVTIVNCTGITVWSGDVDRQSDIDVDSWPKGFYYLRLYSDENENMVKKIIIE